MSGDYEQVCAFLYKEARLLDDRQWDEWLTCYSPTVSYWMPAWDDDDTLVEDPQSEVSLIYYPNRDGLEDRVFRIKTERSSASTPEPRTCHFISNIEIVEKSENSLNVRYNWQTLSHRYKTTDRFFGSTSCTIDMDGNSPLISKKTIFLKDDYIHQVIDIYHV